MSAPGANLGTVIAEGTMAAAVELLRARGVTLKALDVDRLVVLLREEAKSALTAVLDGGKVLVDGGHGGWASKLVTVECAEAARRALDRMAAS